MGESGNSRGAAEKRSSGNMDLEDLATRTSRPPHTHTLTHTHTHTPIVTKQRRIIPSSQRLLSQEKTWRQTLGPPPPMGTTKVC